jgi:hypothetical protein
LQRHVTFLNHLNIEQLQGLLEESYEGTKNSCYHYNQSVIRPLCIWNDATSTTLDCTRTTLQPCRAAFFIRLRKHAMIRIEELLHVEPNELSEEEESESYQRRLEVGLEHSSDTTSEACKGL